MLLFLIHFNFIYFLKIEFFFFFNLEPVDFLFRISRYFKIESNLFSFVVVVLLLMQLSKAARDVSKFATVALVDVDSEDVQVYVKYFDITLIPSTVFFFNAHHMKMDSGYADAAVCCFLFVNLIQFLTSCFGLILSFARFFNC